MITPVLSRTGIVLITLPQIEVMENGGGPGSNPGRSIPYEKFEPRKK
jgi:hypothetical protein